MQTENNQKMENLLPNMPFSTLNKVSLKNCFTLYHENPLLSIEDHQEFLNESKKRKIYFLSKNLSSKTII